MKHIRRILVVLLVLLLTACGLNDFDFLDRSFSDSTVDTNEATSNTEDVGSTEELSEEPPEETTEQQEETSEVENKEEPERIDANGYYSTPEDVALYIYTYGRLPQNYITKGEAQMLGWKSSRGNLWDVTDRMIIGGDRFYNREGLLPNKSGRLYYECDVNYYGGYRGSERLVYSNDGLIYYTKDHYRSFILLYGDES